MANILGAVAKAGKSISNLAKAKTSSAINRINSNLKYAIKQDLENTDLHLKFQETAIKYGVRFTESGYISKKSNLSLKQLEVLENYSKISSKFAEKYGSTKKQKVKDVQKFLNTKIEYIYEKIMNPENEDEFKIAKSFDKMLEGGLRAYEYNDIWKVLNNLGAFDTDYEYNPFLDKYPSRSERKGIKYGQRNYKENNKK